MLPNDEHFHAITLSVFGSFPFRLLDGCIASDEAETPSGLFDAFVRLFHSREAQAAKNVLFVWAVDRPFFHTSGKKLPSTISYIEMSKGTVSGRWPKRYIRKITTDYKKKGEASAEACLEELANKDKNFRFYSRLIRDHGPLRIWYATLGELNQAAEGAHLPPRETVREWEHLLIRAYRGVHGARRRPLKNRRD